MIIIVMTNVKLRKKIMVIFSGEEWLRIKPKNVRYRLYDKKKPSKMYTNYQILAKNQWTPIIAEHFFAHTQPLC